MNPFRPIDERETLGGRTDGAQHSPGAFVARMHGCPREGKRVKPLLSGTMYNVHMSRLTRYILSQLILPILFISVALVGVVWLTQSLRFVDLIVNRGLSVNHFLYLTVLLLPGILAVILPVALLCGVLFTYHRLSFDSEIVVMKAVGLSPRALATPAVVIALFVTVATYGLTLYLQPLGFRTFKDQQFTIRHNHATVLMREGTFNSVIKDVTVYVRERRGGELRGILVHDNREPDRPTTVMAERAVLVQTPAGPRFVMENGNRQERRRDSDQLSLLYFDRYVLDLALIAEFPDTRWREPGERYIGELLFPGDSEAANRARRELRAEAHKRFVTPLYGIAFVLIALAAVLSGEFDRRYEWRRILFAAVGAAAVQVVGIGLVPVISTTPALTPLLYLNVILAGGGAAWILLTVRRRPRPDRPALPQGA